MFPESIEDAIDLWKRGALRIPSRIQTQKDGQWNRIIGREFKSDKPDEWLDEVPMDYFEDEEIPF